MKNLANTSSSMDCNILRDLNICRLSDLNKLLISVIHFVNVYRIKMIRSQIIKTTTNCLIHIVNFNTRKGLIANWRGGGGGFHTSFGSSKSDPRPLSFLYLNVEFFWGKTFFLLLRGSLTMRLRIDEHKSFFFFKQETK